MDNRNEAARLDALRQLDLLDTAPSEAFDRVTRMASRLFDLPISAVSLTDHDRQWFKSRVGVDHVSLPRDKAPCAQVTDSAGTVVIPDLEADPYYCDSPLARSGVRFYAGAPLTTREGFTLGAMCVLGMRPRQASAAEVASLKDLAAMVMSQIELQHAFGRIEPMSGLPNRTQFIEDLEDLAKDTAAQECRLAVLIEAISPEQLGHAVRVMGSSYLDDMVREAARAIRLAVGPAEKIYHVSATQFAFLAPRQTREQNYINSLVSMIEEASPGTSRFVTTPTVGVAPFTLGMETPSDVLRMAHNAEQDARALKSKVSIYSPAHDTAHHRRFTLLTEFGAALEAPDQLSLAYQPRIGLASGACVGAEALLRWTHPSLGSISPGEFIPIIERTNMARSTTAWVLDAAMKQMATWRGEGRNLQISVNISAANLLEDHFADRVVAGLTRHDLPASSLELEVTESAVMENADAAFSVLEALSKIGVRLAIDDFGTGYSSLAYLQRLPAHVVKIDQSFTTNLGSDARTRSLVSTMISLSHDLGYRVVTEGVETREMLEFIEKAGCDEGQGYLFGRPMAPAAFVSWLSGWASARGGRSLLARSRAALTKVH